MELSGRTELKASTHLLAFAIGLVIYWSLTDRHDDQEVKAGHAIPTRAKTRSSANEIGHEIAARILEPRQGDSDSSYQTLYSSKSFPEVLARIDSVDVPEDIRSALDVLVANRKDLGDGDGTRQVDLDIMALCFHWMLKDAVSYLEWANASENGLMAVQAGESVWFPELHKRLGTEGITAMIDQLDPSLRGPRKYHLIHALAKTGDSAGLAGIRNTIEKGQWLAAAHSVGNSWPEDGFDTLFKLALDLDEPDIIAIFGIKGTRGALLSKLLGDESLPEDFRQRLGESPYTRQALIADPEAPLAMRLESGGKPYRLIANDVEQLLDGDRDWLFAFRHGEASAQEIHEVILAKMPELAAEKPDVIRDFVFRELAEENPTAALAMLDDLPEHKRNELALFASRSHFQDVDPNLFLELLEKVPFERPTDWEGRLNAWNRRSFSNNRRLQEAYVDWVRDLPPGIDREMGLYSLARAVNASDSELATTLRSQVSDPELKTRISQNR